jgi:quercetin dioxygenase-like cupin family protein
MKLLHVPLIILSLAAAGAQAPSKAVIANLDTAHWTHDKGDPPGSESVMLHADPVSGGMDLLVRFPAGHVIAPHFHDSNERIVVAEGQLTLRQESGPIVVKTGGFAYLPAHEIQRLTCTSDTRCTFYLSWDGKPASHPAK